MARPVPAIQLLALTSILDFLDRSLLDQFAPPESAAPVRTKRYIFTLYEAYSGEVSPGYSGATSGVKALLWTLPAAYNGLVLRASLHRIA